jgi:hypothetical protein
MAVGADLSAFGGIHENPAILFHCLIGTYKKR